MKRLVLATNNQHKIKEIKTLLEDLDIEIVSLNEISNPPVLIEDKLTFRENALSKARTIFQHTKITALADDSGLEVFFLNGRPGVFSARFAGDRATTELNNKKLLSEMMGVPQRRRKARFVAALALVGEGFEEVTEGICSGTLGEEARGTNGFGYDPLFIPDGLTKTYAELTAEEKNQISHRARALEKMRIIIQNKLK